MEALYPDCEYIYLEGRRADSCRRAKPERELEKEWRERIEGSGECPEESGVPFQLDVECLAMPYPANKANPRVYFVPQPYLPTSSPKEYDVCVCPRKRTYGESKNWTRWQELIDVLGHRNHQVFAAGHPESYKLEKSLSDPLS